MADCQPTALEPSLQSLEEAVFPDIHSLYRHRTPTGLGASVRRTSGFVQIGIPDN